MTHLRAYLTRKAPRLSTDLAPLDRSTIVLRVDKTTASIERLAEFRELHALWIRELKPGMMEVIRDLPKLRDLVVFGLREPSLDALPTGLETLTLEWATKIEDLGPIGRLDQLRIARLGDFKRAHDFSPIAACKRLEALSIMSGMWANQPIMALDFLQHLPALRELDIGPIKLAQGDLRVLGRLNGLTYLALPNTYPVREFARLRVALPNASGPCFQPWHAMRTAAGMDPTSPDGFAWVEEIVLTGRPVRQIAHDDPRKEAKIAAREALFSAWIAHYRSVPDPLTDEAEQLP